MLQSDTLATVVLMIVPLLLSLTVHEWAHAVTAWKLGDDTAARQGRLTLNPLPHIDPIGTLLLPVLMLLSGTGLLFGWARPVPVDPARFRRSVRMKTGMMLTAAAGPASNLALALIAMLVLRFGSGTLFGASDPIPHELLYSMVLLNVALAIFNMLPIPPLDGSKVLMGILPDSLGRRLDTFLARNAHVMPMALLLIIVAGGHILIHPVKWVYRALAWITGGA